MNNNSRKIGIVVSALCATVGLSFCKNGVAQNNASAPRNTMNTSHAETVWTPTNEDRQVGDAMNGFGFRVLQKLDAQKASGANVLFSPLSISTALTLVEQGAAGQTRSEMEKLLQPAGLSAQNVLASTVALTRGWQTADSKVQVDIANSLWMDRKFTLKSAFADAAQKNFDAQISGLDFSSPSAAKTINDWISGKTEGKITAMVSPDALRAAMLVVANAVYFHGDWSTAFDKKNTRDADFHLTADKTIRVPMMSLPAVKKYSYAKTSDAALLALPYGKGNLSMVFLLPDQGVPLSQIVARCDNAQWKTWMTMMKAQDGIIKIPRFTLKDDFILNKMLQQLGLKTAFSRNANFSAMTLVPGVFISQVKHQAWMQVDEIGTEAAAVTTIRMRSSAILIPENPPFQFIADRPFLAAIRDNRSGNLLFVAEVNQPTS